MPKASAASASRRIGRIWLRRNRIATVSSTTEVPTIQIRKMCELEANAWLRWATKRRMALSSLTRISTWRVWPTVSIQKGRLRLLRNSSDSARSSRSKKGLGLVVGRSPFGNTPNDRLNRFWAMSTSLSRSVPNARLS